MKQLVSLVIGAAIGALVGYEVGGRSGERHGRNAAMDELGAAVAQKQATRVHHDGAEPDDVKPGTLVSATSEPPYLDDDAPVWPGYFGPAPAPSERAWPENFIEG